MSVAVLKTFRDGDVAVRRGFVDATGKVATFRAFRQGDEAQCRGLLADGKIGIGHTFRGDVDHAHARVGIADGNGCQDDFCVRVRQQLPAQIHVHILQDLPMKDVYGDRPGVVYSDVPPATTVHCPELTAQGIDPDTIPCTLHYISSPAALLFDMDLGCASGSIQYGNILPGGSAWFLKWDQNFAMWILSTQFQHENPSIPGEFYWTTEFFYKEGNPAFYPNVPSTTPLGDYIPAFNYTLLVNPYNFGEGMFKAGPEGIIPAWLGAMVS